MNQQEIIQKPAALYKNIGPQDKPKQVPQKNLNENPKETHEEQKIDLPPELQDLFRMDRNQSRDESQEETKYNPGNSGAQDRSPSQGSYNQNSAEDYGYEDGETPTHAGVDGQSRKIQKFNRNMGGKRQNPNNNMKRPRPQGR